MELRKQSFLHVLNAKLTFSKEETWYNKNMKSTLKLSTNLINDICFI